MRERENNNNKELNTVAQALMLWICLWKSPVQILAVTPAIINDGFRCAHLPLYVNADIELLNRPRFIIPHFFKDVLY
jgi:hypothetical protein